MKLSRVQTTHCESVLWNDCPISTGVLAMAAILASPDYCQTSAAGKIQVNRTLTPALSGRTGSPCTVCSLGASWWCRGRMMGAAAAPQAGAVASAGTPPTSLPTAPVGRTISNKPHRLGISPLPARMVVDVQPRDSDDLSGRSPGRATGGDPGTGATGCAAPVGVISSMPSKNAGLRQDTALMIPRVIGSRHLGGWQHEPGDSRGSLWRPIQGYRSNSCTGQVREGHSAASPHPGPAFLVSVHRCCRISCVGVKPT